MKTTDHLKKAYNSWHVARAAGENDSLTLSSPWNAFVRNTIGSVQNKKILEIASGRGQLSAFLAGQGADVIAADFSYSALSVIQNQHKYPNLKPVNADATKLGIKTEAVDILVSCETIEHVLEPEKALSEFHRVLKKGGKLFLTFPSYLNTYGLYRIYLKAAGKPYNSGVAVQPIENWLFSFRVLAQLRKTGFKIHYSGGSGFYWLWPGRTPKNLFNHNPQLPLNRLFRPFALHTYVIAEK